MLSLRKNLMQNGTYRVDTHDEGDIIVTGVITAYDRSQISVQPTDVLTVLDYEITMTAQITARERSTGKIILQHPVTASAPAARGGRFDQCRAPGDPAVDR